MKTYLVLGVLVPVATIVALVAALVAFAGVESPLRALGEQGVASAVMLSLATATVASLLGLAVAAPAAYALARRDFPGRRIVDVILDVPVVLSPVALGMMFLFFFRESWLRDLFVFEVPGIVLVQFLIVASLQIRVLKATFEEIPARLETVARFLGCGPGEAFRRVTLPLARPGLVSALILGWARAMGEYGATVTVAGAIRGKTETIPIAIVLNWNAVRLEAAIGLIFVLLATSLLVLVAVRAVGAKR